METNESIIELFGLGDAKPDQPPRFAKVTAVSGDTATVTVGASNVDAVRCCDCAADDVVLLETLPSGQLAAVGVKGYNGGGGGSSARAWYGTCATAASTAAKVVTCPGFTLEAGSVITVHFDNAQTNTAPTLNVNGTGAVPVWKDGAVSSNGPNAVYWYLPGVDATFSYDGSHWNYISTTSVLLGPRTQPTSLNLTGRAGLFQHFHPAVNVTGGTGKNGHYLHMQSTTSNYYASQLYIPIDMTAAPAWRTNPNGTWTAWDYFFTNSNPPYTSGTDGIWTWRKWWDGTAECWGNITDTITGWTAWGSMYYSAPYMKASYPTGLFVAAPVEVAQAVNSGADGWLATKSGTGSATETRQYFIVRPVTGSNNLTATISVHAIGNWQ